MRWGGRQQFRRGVAEAALIEVEVKPGEMRCEGELLAQRSLRQAQCYGDGGRVRLRGAQARCDRVDESKAFVWRARGEGGNTAALWELSVGNLDNQKEKNSENI
jgi:hypothetical protein